MLQLFSLVALSAAASPPCDEVLAIEVDGLSGAPYTVMRSSVVISEDDRTTGLAFRLAQRPGGPLVWSTTAVGAGRCVRDDDRMRLRFVDGERLRLENDGAFNCMVRFEIRFEDDPRDDALLRRLAATDIARARVWTNDGYVERDLPPHQAAALRAGFACMAASASVD